MDGIYQSQCFKHRAGIANHSQGYGEQADSMATSLILTLPLFSTMSLAPRIYFALSVWFVSK